MPPVAPTDHPLCAFISDHEVGQAAKHGGSCVSIRGQRLQDVMGRRCLLAADRCSLPNRYGECGSLYSAMWAHNVRFWRAGRRKGPEKCISDVPWFMKVLTHRW
jgi:hypothetical protein